MSKKWYEEKNESGEVLKSVQSWAVAYMTPPDPEGIVAARVSSWDSEIDSSKNKLRTHSTAPPAVTMDAALHIQAHAWRPSTGNLTPSVRQQNAIEGCYRRLLRS